MLARLLAKLLVHMRGWARLSRRLFSAFLSDSDRPLFNGCFPPMAQSAYARK
jgi:hypothetical protein